MIIKFKGSGPTRSNRGNGNDESHLPFNSIKPDFFPTGFSEAPKNNHPFLKNRLHFEPNILRGAPLNHFGHERAPLVFVFRLGLEGGSGGGGAERRLKWALQILNGLCWNVSCFAIWLLLTHKSRLRYKEKKFAQAAKERMNEMNANEPEKDKMNDLKWLLQERLKAEEIERERKKAHGE